MSDLNKRQRLMGCFQAVFPDASEDAIAAASIESMPGWDSVAQITLITVVEEEFGVELPPGEYETLVSFQRFLTAV
jgi:acyl carrier protein